MVKRTMCGYKKFKEVCCFQESPKLIGGYKEIVLFKLDSVCTDLGLFLVAVL